MQLRQLWPGSCGGCGCQWHGHTHGRGLSGSLVLLWRVYLDLLAHILSPGSLAATAQASHDVLAVRTAAQPPQLRSCAPPLTCCVVYCTPWAVGALEDYVPDVALHGPLIRKDTLASAPVCALAGTCTHCHTPQGGHLACAPLAPPTFAGGGPHPRLAAARGGRVLRRERGALPAAVGHRWREGAHANAHGGRDDAPRCGGALRARLASCWPPRASGQTDARARMLSR